MFFLGDSTYCSLLIFFILLKSFFVHLGYILKGNLRSLEKLRNFLSLLEAIFFLLFFVLVVSFHMFLVVF